MSDGLLPSVPAAATIRIDRELPKECREWGRIIDLTSLDPGDLLLFRPVNPAAGSISKRIMQAQLDGGLHQRHAQWTHAAVYLGDGESSVCEANFKVPGQPDGVCIRSAFAYCDGNHAIRGRRPRNMTPQQRLRIAIGALTSIGKSYSFLQIVKFANAASGGGFWSSLARGPQKPPQAFVCSTLYQDAYNFAFQGIGVRLGSLCTPAHLSASADFEQNDPNLRWLEIV